MQRATMVLLLLLLVSRAAAEDRIQFNRDVRPILAQHCWQCHGFDGNARQAGLRLDTREDAIRPADSGEIAVVPHQPSESTLLKRIVANDQELQMPPPGTGKKLTEAQIETLRNWILQGANYQRHWAFEPLVKPTVPDVAGVTHPIDAFVAARLREEGMDFAPEAARERLLRRVSLDLVGLPPSLEDLDRTSESHEQAVDRLLASPHFGERMAVDWLDAARYADTNGYFSDKPRQMWPWRDWVIEAFNSNMPYDRFTVEQIAGDLLPNATLQNRIATGFNRNHMANNETGIIDEEFRVEYVVDRVDTTMTTWMGLSAGCAQCHDHKYDPITQREFYQLFALFNNIPETGLIVSDNPPPLITVSTPELDSQLKQLEAESTAATAAFEPLRADLEARVASWTADAATALPELPADSLVMHEDFSCELPAGWKAVGTPRNFVPAIRGTGLKLDATRHAEHALSGFDADAAWTMGVWIKPEGPLSCVCSKIEPDGRRRGLELLCQKGRISVHLVEDWATSAIQVTTQQSFANDSWHHVVVSYDGSRMAQGLEVFIDGAVANINVQRDTLAGSIATDEVLRVGRRDAGLGFYGELDELRVLQCKLPDDAVAAWTRAERLRGVLEKSAAARDNNERTLLLEDYLRHQAEPATHALYQQMQMAARAEREFRAAIPTTLVMQELEQPRATHVLFRGQYDQPGERVVPGVPTMVAGWPADEPRNRRGFAHWLVSNDNPLTARVAVNRLWKQCFGEGLVRTMNDFGTQGEPPTHPKLLDWLAVTLRESGWDVKKMIKLMVTSRTYRQDSRYQMNGTDVIDPSNRLLARGASYRMPAEMIRDHALAVSGLLRVKIGGPSVKPYQPAGLWEEVSYNAEDTYVPDAGDGLWRRSLYTYVKRQAPPPSLLTFDGPTRERCTIERARTNTPLQSLLLLNDPTYTEAARALAAAVLETEAGDQERLRQLFRRVLSRGPDETEVQLLDDLLRRQRKRFSQAPAQAVALLAVGASELPDQLEPGELAAWNVVAHTVLNLDEAITRR